MPNFWFNDQSILTKTTGFNALMLALPTVFEQTVRKYDNFELESVKKVVFSLQGLPWLAKDFKGQQGKVAAKQLSETIRKSIINHVNSLEKSVERKRLAI